MTRRSVKADQGSAPDHPDRSLQRLQHPARRIPIDVRCPPAGGVALPQTLAKGVHMNKLSILAAALIAGTALTAQAGPAEDAMNKAGCMACHAKDKKLVGPAFKDIAAKYRARAMLSPSCPTRSARVALVTGADPDAAPRCGQDQRCRPQDGGRGHPEVPIRLQPLVPRPGPISKPPARVSRPVAVPPAWPAARGG